MNADLTKPWDLADVIFIIEEKKVYVNKLILMMSSDIFRTMFTADFREKDLAEIPLPGKNFDAFLLLMKVIHPPNMEVNGTNVLQLLPLSHEYGVHHVTASCEKVLLTEPPSVENLVLADRYSLLQLHETCVQYTQHTPLTQLDTQLGFDELQPAMMVEILRHKVLQTELKQKPEDPKTEEVESAEAEPTKEFIYELMSKAPSVENLLLGEKYNVPPLIQACVKYAQNKPLSKLKAEPGYDKITPATLVQILNEKVVDMEPKMKHLGQLEAKFNKLLPELKTLYSTMRKIDTLYRDGTSGPGLCPRSVKKGDQHTLGQRSSRIKADQCPECRCFALETIYDISYKALQGIYDCREYNS